MKSFSSQSDAGRRLYAPGLTLAAGVGPAAAHGTSRRPSNTSGQALPPPTGLPLPADAGPARPLSATPRASLGVSSRSPAKPSGTLHTGGAFHCCAHPIQAPPPTGTAARLRGPRGALNKGRCLVCWWVIGVVLKPGQVLPPPTGTAVGHQPGAVCPALVSNLARWGVQH